MEIDQQLRAMQGPQMGSMQNFPPPRRSERGYSNDIDSRPNNRGLPRGRGRGGRGAGGGGNSTGTGGAGGSRYHAGNNNAATIGSQ